MFWEKIEQQLSQKSAPKLVNRHFSLPNQLPETHYLQTFVLNQILLIPQTVSRRSYSDLPFSVITPDSSAEMQTG